jgi:hypothetical protein
MKERAKNTVVNATTRMNFHIRLKLVLAAKRRSTVAAIRMS